MNRGLPVLLLVCLMGATAGASTQAAVTYTPIGNPDYVPVGFQLFSAPVGTAPDYADFSVVLQELLPTPNHLFDPAIGIIPGAPHLGPYDTELARNAAASGFVNATSFVTSQYSNGNAVYLAFLLVPGNGSPTGSSPDYASGPIIPQSVLPLTASAETFTNGILNNLLAPPFTVPPSDSVPGFKGYDGQSHIPFFFADSFDDASRRIPGAYEYRVKIVDAAGAGYNIVAPFQVVPEPSAAMLIGVGIIALGGISFHRPQARGTARGPSPDSRPRRGAAGGRNPGRE